MKFLYGNRVAILNGFRTNANYSKEGIYVVGWEKGEFIDKYQGFQIWYDVEFLSKLGHRITITIDGRNLKDYHDFLSEENSTCEDSGESL